MLTRVYAASTVLDENCAWFSLNQVLLGAGEKKKTDREEFLQQAVPDDVKLVDCRSLSSSKGQPLTLADLGAKRMPEKVAVGTTLGFVYAATRNDKVFEEMVKEDGSLHFIRQAINNLDLGQNDMETSQTPPARPGRKRVLFTSTPIFSTPRPMKRKMADNEEDSGLCLSPSITFSEISNSMLESPCKRQRIREKASAIYTGIEDLCRSYRETLADVLANIYLIDSFDDKGKSACKETLVVYEVRVLARVVRVVRTAPSERGLGIW